MNNLQPSSGQSATLIILYINLQWSTLCFCTFSKLTNFGKNCIKSNYSSIPINPFVPMPPLLLLQLQQDYLGLTLMQGLSLFEFICSCYGQKNKWLHVFYWTILMLMWHDTCHGYMVVEFTWHL